ncbi:hypothetical protein OU798_23835 [Prolixibacteraceae bacterium Z1-6]|uniref:Glycoside hydrolase n=1 Tax=Draconibacterium aestuarii TaxID=2998507 RepID=A0A9X3J8D7_9BACT|nr:hypothetical protein [Prolixibacteraceae bacterium Z1-6]
MKKLLIFAFLVAIVAGTVNATVATDNKTVIGEWKYEVPTAPYGYEAGTLVINEKEGKLAGHVKFADGYKIDLKNVSFTEGVFKCGLYVDYEYVSIKAKVTGKDLTGAVNSPEGEMKITAKKVK